MKVRDLLGMLSRSEQLWCIELSEFQRISNIEDDWYKNDVKCYDILKLPEQVLDLKVKYVRSDDILCDDSAFVMEIETLKNNRTGKELQAIADSFKDLYLRINKERKTPVSIMELIYYAGSIPNGVSYVTDAIHLTNKEQLTIIKHLYKTLYAEENK